MAEELALLGHDIRSALADLTAGLGLMDQSSLTAQNQKQLDGITATAESLSRFLDEGLTTLIAQRQPDLTLAPTDIAGVMHDLQRRWAFSAGRKTSLIEMSLCELPERVLCNRTALERALSNLISNALAHSGGRPIRLSVTRPLPDQLRFAIADDGPGFPEAVRNKLGQPPSSAMPAWQDRQGHGLGIRIVTCLARRLNATLTLSNQPNGGALAELVLPVAIVPANQTTAPQTPNLLGLNILIADDSMPQAMLLQLLLQSCDANVTLAHDGPSAEAALMHDHYDVALIDYEMPGRNGFEICQALRAHQNQQENPTRVIILSAHQLPEFQHMALEAGANQVLIKPISSTAVLLAAISPLVAAAPDASTNDDVMAFPRLLDMAGPAVAQELLNRYTEDLKTLQSQLVTAIPAQDWPVLVKASHVLIALAGTAGWYSLEKTARAFNLAATDHDGVALNQYHKAVLDGLVELLNLIARIAQDQSNQP
jgi:CheY-like chemotaxis protein